MSESCSTPREDYPFEGSQEKIIQKAMSFPMDDILKRYCKMQSFPMKVAREHEREIKRFLALTASNPNSTYGMTGPIDELWHTFILFTQKYTDFCYLIAGHYLHHFPSIPNEKSFDIKGYEHFLVDYTVVFDEEPPRHLWPRPQKFRDGLPPDYGECSSPPPAPPMEGCS